MTRHLRVEELWQGIEGAALLREVIDGDDRVVGERVAAIRRLAGRLEDGQASAGMAVPELDVEQGYAAWASVYDSMSNALIEAEEPLVADALAGLGAGRALDAACGTGRHTATLVARGHTTIGVDRSAAMLAVARQKVPKAEFRLGDLEQDPGRAGVDSGARQLTSTPSTLAEGVHRIWRSRMEMEARSGIIPSMLDADLTFWRSQTPVTDPGAAADRLDTLPADPDALTEISSQLVFHYRADGDWEANGISADRGAEINLCYAADMFDRLLELQPSLGTPRPPARRILGCCRDASTLYVSMLRHHHIPARCRVGFAGYFDAGWWVDHVVVEVWDGGRWRMIDPERRPNFSAGDGGPLDRLDLGPDRFLTAAQAWLAARAGSIDPARVVVAPDLDVPDTRGWPQLAHNLVHDIAALNGIELLLWQDWGVSLLGSDALPEDVLELLDRSARSVPEPEAPLAAVRQAGTHELLRVPQTVLQIDPLSLRSSQVEVSRALTAA